MKVNSSRKLPWYAYINISTLLNFVSKRQLSEANMTTLKKGQCTEVNEKYEKVISECSLEENGL